MNHLLKILLTLSVLSISTNAFAGAYVQGKGRGIVILEGSQFRSQTDDQKNLYRQEAGRIYVSTGLGKNLAADLSAESQILDVDLKYGFFDQKTAGVYTRLSAALGYRNQNAQLATFKVFGDFDFTQVQVFAAQVFSSGDYLNSEVTLQIPVLKKDQILLQLQAEKNFSLTTQRATLGYVHGLSEKQKLGFGGRFGEINNSSLLTKTAISELYLQAWVLW